VALHSAELEHRLKAAAGIVQNWTLVVVRCHGRSAVIYLLNETKPNRTERRFLGFKKLKPNRVFEN